MSATIEVGTIVIPVERKLQKLRTMFPQIRSDMQMQVTAIIKRAVYGRGALMVVDKPGGEEHCVWRTQVRKLPEKRLPKETKWV